MQQRVRPEVVACIGKLRQPTPPAEHSTTRSLTMRASLSTRTSFSYDTRTWLEFSIPALFGRGEHFVALAPPEAGSAANHAAEAIRDSLDEFGFTRAPVTRVAHHLAQASLIRGRRSISLARHSGFALFHHAIKRHDTF